MSFEINGKLVEKFETERITDTFQKREFVLEKSESVNDRSFIDLIKFQVTQDRCNLLDNIQNGEEIKVTFNIKGRKWEKNGKVYYINNLEAWRVEKVSSGLEEPPFPAPEQAPTSSTEEDYADDLPF